MAQADGTILIDTEINADGMKAGSKEVEESVRKMADSVNNLGTKAKAALNKQIASLSKLNQEYAAQAKKVDDLKKKVAEYSSQKIPTQEYREIQVQIEQAEKRLNNLIATQERFLALGGSQNSKTFKRYQYDIDELRNTIKYARGELQDLEETGKAFTIGTQTKQAAADMEKLAAAERRLADLNNRLGNSYSSIKGRISEYNKLLLRSDSSQKKATKSSNKLSKSLKNTSKSANNAGMSMGRMLASSILFSTVFSAISLVTSGIGEGIQNLAQYSNEFNQNMSMLMSALTRLKNAFATAFAPILDVVAPILTSFINLLSDAITYVAAFFSALTGKDTFTKAKKVQQDYAESLQDTADSTKEAAKEAEKYLSPLDDINKFTEKDKDKSNKGESGAGELAPGDMFEEVPIDNGFSNLMDTVLDKLKSIKDIVASGFWDGLGDYKPLLNELKSDLSSIGAYLRDIFTDADVQAAAKRFVTSLIYNIGKIAGSFASVGLTIATNVIGGIESYLSENSDRIKTYLVNMFNIGADIFDRVGTLAATVAEIFSSVFGSQVAQDLTGNIIGIFAEAFMGVTSLAAMLGRDLLGLIVTPLVENKEKIKTALLETIAPLTQITQSIEIFIQNVVDKVTTLYNEHVKPFIDSLADGISSIVGTLLDAYNEYIAPILDKWADKFDKVLNGPVSDAVGSLLTVIGKLLDAIKTLWENVLVPLINWIIQNIVPVIAPIIETIGTTALSLLGTVASVVSGILDALGGLIDFIVGIFTGNWRQAWDGIKSIFSGIWKSISSLFTGVWDAIKGVVEGGIKTIKNLITSAWNGIKSLTSTVWNSIKTILSGIWNGLKSAASTAFNAVKTAISTAWNAIKSTTSSVWNSIKSNVNSTFNSIKSKITSIWNSIKSVTSSVWNSIKNTVRGAVNGIIGGINGMIRGAVSGVNSVIRALNNLSFTVPSWVPNFGGKTFGFNIGTISAPQIPYLASGAVIPPNKEFLAILGDQNKGNNIEAPESLIRRIVREESGSGGNNTYEVNAKVGRKELFKIIIDEAKMQRTQTGRNPFELA